MNDEAGGRRRWYVPDAYLPGDSSHGVESHESACVLNTGSQPAVVSLTFYFEDRDPSRPGRGDGRLAAHTPRPADGPRPAVRASSCRATSRLPTPPSATSPIVLQHSRLDTSAGAYTLGTTIAYGE